MFGRSGVLGGECLRLEQRERDGDARGGHGHRDADEQVLRLVCQRAGAGEQRCGTPGDRLEPCRQRTGATQRQHGWELQPAANERQRAQHDERATQNPGCIMHLGLDIGSGAKLAMEGIAHQSRHVDRRDECRDDTDTIREPEYEPTGHGAK